ncbi:hypothetical protein [Burkholderia pseudomallei]|uniref:hypothetical protein n=1 Tax=Burkholderia pseudomallei TaxID=28450 RepID=UPI0012B7279C|nr:hypothetical protein [Burkholderia pseudomallei]
MNFDLAYQGLMARLDSIFPVNPEKHELIEITVRRIRLHGELKKPFLTASFKPRIRTGGLARSAAIGRRQRQEGFPRGEQGGLQQHNASSFMASESRDPFILFLFTVSRFDYQFKIHKQNRK